MAIGVDHEIDEKVVIFGALSYTHRPRSTYAVTEGFPSVVPRNRWASSQDRIWRHSFTGIFLSPFSENWKRWWFKKHHYRTRDGPLACARQVKKGVKWKERRVHSSAWLRCSLVLPLPYSPERFHCGRHRWIFSIVFPSEFFNKKWSATVILLEQRETLWSSLKTFLKWR
jgi:hypothetical protein